MIGQGTFQVSLVIGGINKMMKSKKYKLSLNGCDLE